MESRCPPRLAAYIPNPVKAVGESLPVAAMISSGRYICLILAMGFGRIDVAWASELAQCIPPPRYNVLFLSYRSELWLSSSTDLDNLAASEAKTNTAAYENDPACEAWQNRSNSRGEPLGSSYRTIHVIQSSRGNDIFSGSKSLLRYVFWVGSTEQKRLDPLVISNHPYKSNAPSSGGLAVISLMAKDYFAL